MAVDLDAGNGLDLSWLSGGVVALGERCGDATPLSAIVAAMLSPYVNRVPTVAGTPK